MLTVTERLSDTQIALGRALGVLDGAIDAIERKIAGRKRDAFADDLRALTNDMRARRDAIAEWVRK